MFLANQVIMSSILNTYKNGFFSLTDYIFLLITSFYFLEKDSNGQSNKSKTPVLSPPLGLLSPWKSPFS